VNKHLIVALAVCLQVALAQPHGGFVTAAGTQFLDPAGRPLVPHGVSIANKNPAEGYTAGVDRSDMAAIRSWGMNCIRLAIFWDGIEPRPGKIDRAYLDRVKQMVGWAKAEGLYVLIDMHQDLFSVKYSDGAPAWATLDDGKPHVKGAVWSDSYYASGAVQSALDHFWANSPAPDGKPLQEHYALAWRAVAETFKDEPAVLGYDLMNEPFPGADAPRTMLAAVTKLAEMLAAKKVPNAPDAETLAGMEMTPEGRRQITAWLGDIEMYKAMLAAAEPVMQDFDRTRLMPMYQRIRHAIRAVDRNHLLFIEPAMSANMGIRTAVTPLVDEAGKRDPKQAYAPHGYDIVVDTSSQDLNNRARIELIFARHGEVSRKYSLPMLIGEWGALPDEEQAAGVARFTIAQFDKLGCGDIYWAYGRHLGHSPLLPALKRQAAFKH
jgi:endoglycosylceramidase